MKYIRRFNENIASGIKDTLASLGSKESIDMGRVKKIIQYLIQDREAEALMFGDAPLLAAIKKYLAQIPENKIQELKKKSSSEIQSLFNNIEPLISYLGKEKLI